MVPLGQCGQRQARGPGFRAGPCLCASPVVTCASRAPSPAPPRGTKSSSWWTSQTFRRSVWPAGCGWGPDMSAGGGGRVQTPDVGAPSRDSPAPISVPGPRASPPTAPWAGARARSDHSTAGPSSVRPHASGQVRHSFVCGRGRAPAPPSPALSPSWLLAAAGRPGPCGSRGPWARRSRRPWVQAGGSALPAGRGDRVLPSSSTRSFPCCRARAWGSPCQRHRPRK